MFKWFYAIFIINFLILGYIGGQAAEEPYITVGQIATTYYFAYFLIILPILNKIEKPLETPKSIYDSCVPGEKKQSKVKK